MLHTFCIDQPFKHEIIPTLKLRISLQKTEKLESPILYVAKLAHPPKQEEMPLDFEVQKRRTKAFQELYESMLFHVHPFQMTKSGQTEESLVMALDRKSPKAAG